MCIYDFFYLVGISAYTQVKELHYFQVSLLHLQTMQETTTDGWHHALQGKIVYSLGDHYYFRKDLKILNLVTGMIHLFASWSESCCSLPTCRFVFLPHRFGRIRRQCFGFTTQEELLTLLSSTSQLLQDKWGNYYCGLRYPRFCAYIVKVSTAIFRVIGDSSC